MPAPAAASQPAKLLYKFAWVKSLRMLLRMKVLQIAGGLGFVVPAATLIGTSGGGHLGVGGLAALSAGVIAVASTCSWYCQRLVQELRVVGGSQLRISTLSMWGHRQDRDVNIADVVPTYSRTGPEGREVTAAFVPLFVAGSTFILADPLNSSTILRHPLNQADPAALRRLLCGLPPLPALPGEPDAAGSLHTAPTAAAPPRTEN